MRLVLGMCNVWGVGKAVCAGMFFASESAAKKHTGADGLADTPNFAYSQSLANTPNFAYSQSVYAEERIIPAPGTPTA